MTTSTLERPSRAVAAEVRAEVARQGLTHGELANRLHHNATWLSVRIGKSATVDMTLDEIAEIAEALGVEAEGFVMTALRARRDSNPKPSDLVLAAIADSVNRRLTVDRRYRDAWGLAA